MTGKWARHLVHCVAVVALMTIGLPTLTAQKSGNPVSASVQPAQVTVGDSFEYNVTVSLAGAAQKPTVSLPVLASDTGLSAPAFTGEKINQFISSGFGGSQAVATLTYSYTITTSKEGRFSIPPATVTIGGKTYDTEPVEVLVQEAPKAKDLPKELEGLVTAPIVRTSPELQRKLTGAIFILPILSNNAPYNGEQVRIAYHLVIDLEALTEAGLVPRVNLDGVSEPAMNDFIKQILFPFPQEIKFQDREFSGKVYKVAPIYEAAITSTKTGKLNIENFQISMIFSMKNQRSRSPFPDDPFFGGMPFGLGGPGVQVVAQSPRLTLDVQAPPAEGKPAGFSGAVGNYNITAEVDKKQARAYDDTIELALTITGDGNTESLSPPNMPSLQGFTVLGEPEEKTAGRKENDRYISTKKFIYTVRPTTPGNQVIPAITLDTFDPVQKKYVEVKSDPIPIIVQPGTKPVPQQPTQAAGPDKSSPEVTPATLQESEYRYVYTGSLRDKPAVERLFGSRLGMALFGIPLLLLCGAAGVGASRRYAARELDVRKQALSASSQHLRQAHQALTAGRLQDMYAELGNGLRQHFAARLNVPVAEVTVPELEEQLERRGAPAELVKRLTGILETCDGALYSPQGVNDGNARELYKTVESVLKETEKYV